ncbi:flagellar protein [Neobacillus ginsengisoli]|uniref:Flagellar operon protein (TIGR03826 family) n=1 Tax=Neobacillus ginsengisoli TaxID=904295 RepID=A0ABT9XVI2_9BACI|nr:flagellar protein [Neobacillus ginsengisoli]MDQ0199582.1 flagellar operon protein (TIGR03826 family) [Neobacillus ginsengisoli]
MGTPKLGNCSRCGKLFLRIRNFCDECYQKQEDDFLKAAAFLRDFPGSTIQEVNEATKVTVAQIRQFIWDGRILVSDLPNLSYPCETCGNMIRAGRTCSTCIETLNKLASQINNEKNEINQERNGKTGGYIKNYL